MTERQHKDKQRLRIVADAIEDRKGERIVAIDLTGEENAICDFFIIGEANNPRQTRAIAELIEEKLKETCSIKPTSKEGMQRAEWIILDYGDMLIHIMFPTHRSYYCLDELWKEAPRKMLSTEKQPTMLN